MTDYLKQNFGFGFPIVAIGKNFSIAKFEKPKEHLELLRLKKFCICQIILNINTNNTKFILERTISISSKALRRIIIMCILPKSNADSYG